MSSLFSKALEVGAIDIGSSFIKIAMTKKEKNGYSLLRYATAPTPPMSVKGGVIVDVPSVAEAISNLCELHKIKMTKASTAVSGQQVVIRPIQMPKMDQSAVNDSIKFEAETYLPYSPSEAQVSGQIVVPELPNGKMEVLLIAVPLEIARNYREVVKSVGMEPASIDLESISMGRALGRGSNAGMMGENNVGILNIGASTSSFNVYYKGVIRHNRTVNIAGDAMSKAISADMSVSIEEAESLKVEKGLVRFEQDGEALAPSVMKLASSLETVVEDLSVRVKRSVDFCRSRYRESIAQVYIVGGGACLPGIAGLMGKKIGVPCVVPDVFENISTDAAVKSGAIFSGDMPEALPVLGLALKEE